MTTMNKVRAWSFAAFLGALALGDWQITNLVADGEEVGLPAVRVGGVAIKGEAKDVAVGDKIEKHWVVSLDGDGQGDLALTCTSMPWDPLARMMPKATVIWSKTVHFDTSASRSIDLGAAPEARTDKTFSLVVGGDPLMGAARIGWIKPLPPAPLKMEPGDSDRQSAGNK